MKRAFVCRGRYQSLQRNTVTSDQHLHSETMRFFFRSGQRFCNSSSKSESDPKRWIGEHKKHRADLDAPEKRP